MQSLDFGCKLPFWTAKMGSLVTLCSGTFSVLILAASVGLPTFIVPNHPDLTIKTRRISGDWLSQVDTLYLKGARERTEIVTEEPARADAMELVMIRQCDKKRAIDLNERDKIYAASEIEDWAERLKKPRPVRLNQMSGAEVTVTIDSIDTGERRQFAHYTARHVKVKTQVEPSPGASTPASVEETDGWYIDLPGLGCQDQTLGGIGFTRLGSANRQDRVQIKWLGKAPRGYPIEVTTITTNTGNKTISKVELLEISEAPLNPSLFDLPAGYRRALQTGNGGADLTKPDTISNRGQYYWTRLTFWVRGLFR
jgi:hypothetical protein